MVSLDPRTGGGFEVTDSALDVRGTVAGLDADAFQGLADTAEKGCPISDAMRGNVTPILTAALDS